jgi:hypothetical protein
MRTSGAVEALRQRAYAEQGWDADGERPAPVNRTEAENRAYAEGVEAALLWALERAGEPFPR